MKIATFFNGIILFYIGLVGLLSFFGAISFGYGLGDVCFLIGIVVSYTLQLILTIIFSKTSNTFLKKNGFFILSFLSLFVALYLTWNFTLGRGIEHKWDGSIFKY